MVQSKIKNNIIGLDEEDLTSSGFDDFFKDILTKISHVIKSL